MRYRFALLPLVILAFAAFDARAAKPDPDDDDDDEVEVEPAHPAAPPPKAWSLDLTIHDVGIGIGNSAHVDGLRLNFRDFSPAVVHGINLTIWSAANNVESEVDGLAIGLPMTDAAWLRGLAVGVGVGSKREIDGIALGVLGVGSGGDVNGLTIGGLGLGAGQSVRGLALGGLGVGAGQSVAGIALGGLGIGAGKNVSGIALGGLGVGAGRTVTGIALGGLGVGAGESITGIAIGGLGVGAGRSITGLAIGGVGVGAGRSIDGAAIALLGIGSPTIHGMIVSLASGGREITGVAIAPAYFNIVEDGRFRGLAVSAFNRIQGEQDGLAIGIFNYAEELHGVQLGLLNWAGNNPSGLKLLPIANAHL